MSIRVAVIEVSHWHALKDAAYLTHFDHLEDANVVALHDPDEEVANRVAAEVGVTAVYSDYERMLEDSKPDFVLALGRHNKMAETAHHLLDHGFPFMMEKPLGVNADEVRGISAKVEATGGFAAVPLFMRYMPFVAQARKMLADGSLGTVSHFYARINRPSSARYVAWGSPWMLDPDIAGGGSLRNLGLHGLDMFLHLIEGRVQVTGAQISSQALGAPVEDFASVLLRSESGVMATVEVGNTFPFVARAARSKLPSASQNTSGDGEYKLSGSDAMLTSKDGVLRVISKNSQEVIIDKPKGPPSQLILRDTILRWQQGKAPVATVRECCQAMELVDQAYEYAGSLPV